VNNVGIVNKAYSLIEMMVSFLVVTVMVLSLMMMVKSAIEEKQVTRLKLHQQIILNNFSLLFRTEANEAYAVASDVSNNSWVMFENDAYVVRYVIETTAGQTDFVREVSNKANPLPTVLRFDDRLPADWAGRAKSLSSAREQFPLTMQPQINFTCGATCFDITLGNQVRWNQPGVETVTPTDYRTLVTDVFGEMRYGVRDIIVVRKVGLFIP